MLVALFAVAGTLPALSKDYTVDDLPPLEPVNTNGLARVEVYPKHFVLARSWDRLQLVVTGFDVAGRPRELTRVAAFRPDAASVLRISPSGLVSPQSNGTARVSVEVGGRSAVMTVEVRVRGTNQPVSFLQDTLPVLSKAGCSSGSCHGSPNGKAGFRLSLRASDPALDRLTLIREERGRRTNPLDPDDSLILLKPAARIAHEGGQRLREGDDNHRILRAWIAEGCPVDDQDPACVGLELHPGTARVIEFPDHSVQISVIARYADGSRRDVTRLAVFESSDPKVARVGASGLVVGVDRGEAAVLVRYLQQLQSIPLLFVRPVRDFTWVKTPAANYVDQHVHEKLRLLQYSAAGPCTDQEFVRRVFLDVIGLLPTAEETAAFLEDTRPDRRARLIDTLLDRPEYARFWAQKWGDLLRVSRKQLGVVGARKLNRWLEHSLAVNEPFDEFVRTLLTASGRSHAVPAVNYYRAAADPVDAMESTVQLFLGTRIQCAKCHNHPYEHWTQTDYFGLASVFARVKRGNTRHAGEIVAFNSSAGEVTHPQSGKAMRPWVPGRGELAAGEPADRRSAFADWLTAKDNSFLARAEVNRLWAQLMGRGIVEPFDDFRDSNPPANGPLLDALARDFIEHGFDRKHVLRVILNSRTYQASSHPDRFNREDAKYFSHYLTRRLTAEQLVDALGRVTGRNRSFHGVPAGTPATQLPAPDLQPPDQTRIGSVDFLKVFGQPERQTVCGCGRTSDLSLGQALQLWNGEFVHQMITDRENALHQWVKSGMDAGQLVEKLYLAGLSRRPDPSELRAGVEYLNSHPDRAAAAEDVCWALINRNEFLFQH